jgi:hypothetical protein
MKTISIVLFLSITVPALSQNNRGLVFNKELKTLVGKWEGTTVYTDPKKNNAQVTLKTRLEVVDLSDSLQLYFTYTDPEGKDSTDTSILRIYDKEDKLRFDHQLFTIGSTARKGSNIMMVMGERPGYDNIITPGFDPRLKADFRQTMTFGPKNLNIVRELRYEENEFYFIRVRSVLVKK